MRSLPRYGHPCSTYDDDMECVILLTHDTTACLCLPLFSLHHSYTYNIMHVVPSEGSRLECLFSHHWFYFFIGKCSIIQITPKINFFKLHIIEFHFQHQPLPRTSSARNLNFLHQTQNAFSKILLYRLYSSI